MNDKLVLDNMNLAYKIALMYKSYANSVIGFEDIQQICLEGLIRAAKAYEPTRGVAFSTFAYTVIKNYVVDKLQSHKSYVSLDALYDYSDDNETVLLDLLTSETDIEADLIAKERDNKLHQIIHELDEPYRVVIEYKLKGLTSQQIGDILGQNGNTINFKYRKALNILRYKYRRITGDNENEL